MCLNLLALHAGPAFQCVEGVCSGVLQGIRVPPEDVLLALQGFLRGFHFHAPECSVIAILKGVCFKNVCGSTFLLA